MRQRNSSRRNDGYQRQDGVEDLEHVNEPDAKGKWAQQVVPAWYPIRSNNCVMTLFFCIGLFLVVLGVVLHLVFNTKVIELEARYDNALCPSKECILTVQFDIAEDMKAPVFLYYKLSGYYQNHRFYAQSRHDDQLHGEKPDTVSSCYPLSNWRNAGDTKEKMQYPCGLVANSFFNDTVSSMQVCRHNSCQDRALRKHGIAWPTDVVGGKYKTREMRPGLETDKGPGGYALPKPSDEDMVVWMRVAAMSTFKKLFRIIDTDLAKGSIVKFEIHNTYPAPNFQKALVLANASAMGGNQSFQTYFCIIFGAQCMILTGIFYFCNRNKKADSQEYFYSPDE